MRAAQSNPFSLRALVKAAQVISAPPPTGKSPHALGLGISTRTTYRSFSGAVSRLPSTDDGLTHLRASAAVAVPGLRQEFSDGAWGALLGRPQLIVDLASTHPDDFLASGQVLPTGLADGSLRHVAIAVVAMPDTVALSGERELQATPVAGVAQLALATRDRADLSSDAWIVAHWYDSAEETAAALAYLHGLSGMGLPKILPKSVVLLTDSEFAWHNDTLDERIRSCAALLDYHIAAYRPKDYSHKALVHVRRTPPDILLVADSSPSRCGAAIDAYLATSKAAGLRYCDSGELGYLVSGIRRRLIVASGVSLNLLSIAQAPAAETEQRKGRLPIIREGRRLYHRRTGRVYIECEVSGFFFSIDTARHASTASKRFVMHADGLHWDADLDANGNVIVGKFKGESGKFIATRELGSG